MDSARFAMETLDAIQYHRLAPYFPMINMNTAALLREIWRQEGVCSPSILSKTLNVCQQTVRNQIKKMVSSGMLVETGLAPQIIPHASRPVVATVRTVEITPALKQALQELSAQELFPPQPNLTLHRPTPPLTPSLTPPPITPTTCGQVEKKTEPSIEGIIELNNRANFSFEEEGEHTEQGVHPVLKTQEQWKTGAVGDYVTFTGTTKTYKLHRDLAILHEEQGIAPGVIVCLMAECSKKTGGKLSMQALLHKVLPAWNKLPGERKRSFHRYFQKALDNTVTSNAVESTTAVYAEFVRVKKDAEQAAAVAAARDSVITGVEYFDVTTQARIIFDPCKNFYTRVVDGAMGKTTHELFERVMRGQIVPNLSQRLAPSPVRAQPAPHAPRSRIPDHALNAFAAIRQRVSGGGIQRYGNFAHA